jgi:tRNA(Ile)-lysidine synthase
MFGVDRLAEALARLGVALDSTQLCVGFSGGLDSSVLLHALAALAAARRDFTVRALHVNHHLHPRADAAQEKAAEFAARLSVPFTVGHARLIPARGASVEAMARDARYEIFEAALAPGEYLLTAHHRDDQLETVLLQLLRGAGVAGLSAMPGIAGFGAGWHVRPLLDTPRDELHAYAGAQGLEWVEDPTNEDQRFDRNYLRREIAPRLRARWPAASRNISRSATLLAEAEALLEEVAADDVRAASDGPGLRVSTLRAFSPARRRNALRHWIRSNGHPAPSVARLRQVLEEVLEARPERSPVVRWADTEVRRYRDGLYLMASPSAPPKDVARWDWKEQPVLDLGAPGQLCVMPAGHPGMPVSGLPVPLRVSFRHGTVRLRPEKNRPSRTLKQLFQEAGVVPWLRSSVPLLYTGERLVAVGDLWLDERFQPEGEGAPLVLQWRERPPLF